MATGQGSKWCALCNRPNDTGACIGCGDGSGDGSDGLFAHVECYRMRERLLTWMRSGDNIGGDDYVARTIADAIETGIPFRVIGVYGVEERCGECGFTKPQHAWRCSRGK